MAKKMSVFIFEEVLCDYTDGLIVVVAPNVKEARKIIRNEISWISEEDLMSEPKKVDMTQTSIHWVCGGG